VAGQSRGIQGFGGSGSGELRFSWPTSHVLRARRCRSRRARRGDRARRRPHRRPRVHAPAPCRGRRSTTAATSRATSSDRPRAARRYFGPMRWDLARPMLPAAPGRMTAPALCRRGYALASRESGGFDHEAHDSRRSRGCGSRPSLPVRRRRRSRTSSARSRDRARRSSHRLGDTQVINLQVANAAVTTGKRITRPRHERSDRALRQRRA
jgi:hypothetical protein